MTDAGVFSTGQMTGIVIGMAVILMVQTALVLWAARRMAELAHMRERLSRLADGLALLTDTTEAGLTTIARELQQQTRRPVSPRTGSRAAVSKRVLAAVRKGQDVAAIAGQEALSESEIHLHLKLADGEGKKPRSAKHDVRSAEEEGYGIEVRP